MLVKGAERSFDALVRALYEGCYRMPASEFAGWAMAQISAEMHCTGVVWEVLNPDDRVMRSLSIGIVESRDQARPEQRCLVELPAAVQPLRHRLCYLRERGSFSGKQRLLLTRLSAFAIHAERLSPETSRLRNDVPGNPLLDNLLGTALVADEDRLVYADDRFGAYLRYVQPNWNGRALPFSAKTLAPPGSQPLPYRGLVVWGEPHEGYIRVSLRFDRRKWAPSQREYEIAVLVSRGFTFKEVARQLSLAPSTVSSHVYKLYNKLGISRRAELVEWIQYKGE